MKRVGMPWGLLVVLAVAALCLVTGPPIGRRAVALVYEHSMGNMEHFLNCSDLPEVGEVEQTLHRERDVVDRILQVNPGHIAVYADSGRCPGKADIVILFATIEDSRAIRRIIGGDAFFDIPYRMYNT
jgi:hypothetical protein